jgi:transcriptional regulator with XRE-family HTH domain
MKHKPDFIDREIGRRLRVARISANIRQYRAAKAVGVTYQQMRKYEVGYNRVSAVIVARLAQIYRRPVGWFLEEVTLGEDVKTDPLLAAPIAQADHHTRANGVGDRPEHTGN